MGIKVTGNASTASVTSVRPRVSVSVVEPAANVLYTLAASKISYIELTASAYLDTSGRFRYIKDAVVAADGTAFLLAKAFADPVEVSDDQALGFEKSLEESISLEDAILVTIIFLRDLDDLAEVSDELRYTLAKAAVDAVVMSDALSRVVSKPVTDTQAVIDAAAKTVAKALAHSVSAGDEASLSYTKLVADAVTTADDVVRATTKALADVQVVVDTATRSHEKSISDGVGINDGFGAQDGLDFVFSTAFANVAFVADTAVKGLQPGYSESVSAADSGFVVSQDYCDPTYFLEDYVGTAVVF
jgi:hypothetical protein